MTGKEQIKSAYKQLGGSASFYDGMIKESAASGAGSEEGDLHGKERLSPSEDV